MARTDIDRIQSNAGFGVHLDLLGFVAFPPGHAGVSHSHPFWELIYIGEGHGVLERRGGPQACAPEDLVLVAPGEKHQFTAGRGAPLDQLYIGFTFRTGGSAPLVPALPRILPPTAPIQLIRAEVKDCHALLKSEGKPALGRAALKLMPALARLAGLIAGLTDSSAPDPQREANPFQLARELIHSNPKTALSVAGLAKRFCLSPKYFGEGFKREVGMSVREYQNDLRLARARELILATDKPISAIADEVGIVNTAYFARQFRKKFRVSARECRQARPARAPAAHIPKASAASAGLGRALPEGNPSFVQVFPANMQ